jgi:hypothetical protein
MSLTLLTNPQKTKNAIVSNVAAGITQLPYSFKRTDYGGSANPQADGDYVDGGQNRGTGFLEIVFDAGQGDVTTSWSVGESVYYGDGGGVYDITANITEVRFSGGFTRITLDAAYTANSFSSIQVLNKLSERSDYAVEINIEDSDNSVLLVGLLIYIPSQAGDLFVDLGPVVVSLIEQKQLNTINYRIQYRETYTGFDPSFTNDAIIQAVLGERSIGLELGSNLWEKLLKIRGQFQVVSAQQGQTAGEVEVVIEQLFDGSDATGIDVTGLYNIGDLVGLSSLGVYSGQWRIKSKRFSTFSRFVLDGAVYQGNEGSGKALIYDRGAFLTLFNSPKYWKGWGQGFTFIVDSNYLTRTGSTTIIVEERAVDINGVSTGPTDSFTYQDTPIRLQEHIIVDDDAIILKDQPNLKVRALDNATTEVYAESILSRVSICKNPIMVTWVNSLGASEYYLFEITQEVLLNATEGLVYQQSRNQDVENVHRQKIRLSSDETLRIVCRAEKLTQNDIRALHELKTSEKVEVYLSQDGIDRVGVIVSEGFATNYDTDDPLNEFTIVLEFPEDYKFFDVKTY